MNLNAKEISLRLCIMLVAFYNKSYLFVQKHPVVSGVVSICLIVYIFLSYIYSFLVYLSPFIVVAAIFIRIFWTSEQPQLIYVKREKRRSDFKHSGLNDKNSIDDFVLDKYYTPSSHYNSRRRSCRDKKWGLHGGNTEFNNVVSEINTENKGIIMTSLDRSRDSSSDDSLPAKKSASPNQKTLRSEPSMSDLVQYEIMEGIKEYENTGPKNDVDDRMSKICNKDSMDVGILELERKSRMENLIANSKARKELMMQLDKGVNRTHLLAPVLVTRNNSFRGSKRFEIDGPEMPDSAPSMIRPTRTFSSLHNSSQEKPTLHQESTQGNQKYKAMSRHESFSASKFKRLPDKEQGIHDMLIENMFSRFGIFDESNMKSLKPQSNCKEPIRSNNRFAETCQNTSSLQKDEVSEKPEPRVHNMTPEEVLKFPISKSTDINESLFKSLTAPTERQFHKTPTYSIASDLQVEVSEVGSPRKTFNNSNSGSNEESSVYDGDNEKDYCSSGSEDIWGNSIHMREAVHEIDDYESTPKANINSNEEVLSPFPLQEINEENSADVSSVSSTCELPGDTPTCAMSYHQNLFGDMRATVIQNQTSQPLNSLDVPSFQENSESLEVPSIKEKQVEFQTLLNQECFAEPCMNAKAIDSRSSNNFEGEHDYSKEKKALSGEIEYSEEPTRVIQPENFIMPTTMQYGEPPEEKPDKMQHYRSGYLTT